MTLNPHIANLAAVNDPPRLAALAGLDMLDTLPELVFDDLSWLAAALCGTPIALTSLVDRERQWFKAQCGLGIRETPVSISFCSHAIESDEIFIVCDASKDRRFQDNPLVTGEPRIRFYAGAPLVGSGGFRYGTLCVLDKKPRTLSPQQCEGLIRLARRTVDSLESRRKRQHAEARQTTLERLLEAMPDGVVTCSADGQLQMFNRQARSWHGVDPTTIPPEQWPAHFGLCDASGARPLAVDEIPLLRALAGDRFTGQGS